MARTAIVGDGPAGLSAALFLAKNGQDVVVIGNDETAMHYALLHNYLGIDEVDGSDFQLAARAQVERFGAVLIDDHVASIRRDGDRFVVETDTGRSEAADYVILAAAKKGGELAEQVGLDATGDGLDTDRHYRTAVDRVYAVGRLALPNRSQAIISAGAGAIAALDVLSREAGKDVHDWESPESAT
jgi:thioredoxin reductase (NADPH)